MKRFALFYVLLSFVMIVFASCEKPNDDIDNLENNEIIDVPDENDTIPAAFYEVIDDIQLVALDFVDDMFSSLEQTEQTIAFKEFMVSYINNATDKVE